MQLGTPYYLVPTTYSPDVTAAFKVVVYGSARVGIARITFPQPMPFVRCFGSAADPMCPVQLARNEITHVYDFNRALNGGTLPVNKLFFNLEDPMTTNGYVQTIQIQYGQGQYPSPTARIWIYGVVPLAGSYIVCSQYAIPRSQISTSQANQTYRIPSNAINVFNGAYVGMGIQDSKAAVATTNNGFALHVNGADQTTNVASRDPLYFQLDRNRIGVKLTYTIVT
ncbi:unnamed protein product [Rotaria sp. Silwood2]|nr:unnamed protein product [Rotaria sp. Silwood2]CAF4262098.1 unnamed protein product [Rotaria sp. Silwood2]